MCQTFIDKAWLRYYPIHEDCHPWNRPKRVPSKRLHRFHRRRPLQSYCAAVLPSVAWYETIQHNHDLWQQLHSGIRSTALTRLAILSRLIAPPDMGTPQSSPRQEWPVVFKHPLKGSLSSAAPLGCKVCEVVMRHVRLYDMYNQNAQNQLTNIWNSASLYGSAFQVHMILYHIAKIKAILEIISVYYCSWKAVQVNFLSKQSCQPWYPWQ